MDILDIITGRAGMTYTGRYFTELPGGEVVSVTINSAEYFDYEHIDVTEWRYQKLLANLVTCDNATETIKTRSPISFRPNTHVALQNGKVYLITSVTNDNTKDKQAGLFSNYLVGADKVLRLLEVDDIYGIGGAPTNENF